MKKIFTKLFFLLLVLFALTHTNNVWAQCTSNPDISNTETSSAITNTTATLGGNISDVGTGGGCNVTERGISWSTVSIADAQTLGGGSSTKVSATGTFSTGSFTMAVSSLPAGTRIYFVSFATNNNGTDISNGDDFYTLSNTPSPQLTSGDLTLTPVNSQRIDLTVTAPNSLATPAFGYIVYRKVGSAPTVPALTNGSAYGTGGDYHSIITGGTTSVQHMGLTTELHYFYTLVPFGYNGSNAETYSYNTTSPVSKDAWSLSVPPEDQGTSNITATASSPITIGLAFTSVTAMSVQDCDGFIILRRIGTDPDVTTLLNGQAPSASTYYLTTTDNDDVSFSHTPLLPNTTYHYAIVRYNWDGSHPETYRYRTADELDYDSETTPKSTVTLTGITTGGSNGLASTFVGGNNDLGVLGFSLNSANGPFTFDSLKVSINNNPAAKLTNFELFASVDNALGGGDDTSLGTIAVAGSGPYTVKWSGLARPQNQSTTYYYFLVADVDPSIASSSPFTISFSQAQVGIPDGTIGAVTVSRAITADPATTTIADRNTPGTHGVAADGLLGGTADRAILGFALTSNGSQTASLIKISFDADPDDFFNNYRLIESTDDILYEGSDGAVPLTSANVTNPMAGVWEIELDPVSDLSVTASERRFFLVANVNNTVTTETDTIQATLSSSGVTVSPGATTGSATGINYDFIELSTSIANRNTPGTHGVAADGLVGGTAGRAILGFALASNGTQSTSQIEVNFDADPALFYNTYSLVESTDDILFEGTDGTVSLSSALVSNPSPGVWTLTIQPSSALSITTSERRFFLVANVNSSVASATDAIQASVVDTCFAISPGSITGSATGIDYDFIAVVTSVADRNVPGTHGVAADGLVGGMSGRAILGFALASTGGQTTSQIEVNFDADPALFYNTYSLVESTDDILFEGTDGAVSLASAPVVSNPSPGVWTLTIQPSSALSITTSERRFFLVADVNNSVTTATDAIAASVVDTCFAINAGSVTGSATGIDYDFIAVTASIANRNTPGTHGVAADGLVGGTTGRAILGFALTSNGGQSTSQIEVNFDADPALFYNTYSLVESTDDILFEGTDGAVPVSSALVSNPSPGVWTLTIQPSSALSITTSERRFFLVANVNSSVTTVTDAIRATVVDTCFAINAGSITGSATGIDYNFIALAASIANRNTPGTHGVAADGLVGGATGRAILGFALASNGTQSTSQIEVNFDADPDAFYNSYSLVESTDDILFEGTDGAVALSSALVSNPSPGVWTLTIQPSSALSITTSERRFFVVANVDNTVTAATDAIQASVVDTSFTITPGSIAGSATGIDYDFVGLTTVLTQLTNGISPGATPLAAGSGAVLSTSTNAILGFSLLSNGSQDVSAVTLSFDTDPTGKFSALGLRSSTDNTFSGGDALVATTSSGVSGTGPYFITLTITTPINVGTLRNLFVVATISGAANTTTASITPSLTSADVTLAPVGITPNSFNGETYSFVPSSASLLSIHTANGVTSPIGFSTYSTQTASANLTWGGAPNSTSLANFRVRDGGGSSDLDTQPTVITDLTITISNPSDLRSVALFVGSSIATSNTRVAEQLINQTTGELIFTGLSITAADNNDQYITVRATFNNTPNNPPGPLGSSLGDNNPHEVVITAVTAATNGSALIASPLTGATTGVGASINNLDIDATKLIFFDLPTEAPPTPYTFTAVVHATDANNNIDVDHAETVTMTEIGPGTGNIIAGDGPISSVGGTYTFNALRIDLAGTYNLIATDQVGVPDLVNANGSIIIKSLGPDIIEANMASCVSRTTTNGTNFYVQLDTLLMAERDPGDFNPGNNRSILLFLPNGWEYLTPSTGGTTSPIYASTTPTISYSTNGGTNFTNAVFNNFIGNNIAKFTISVSGTNEEDTLMITGLYVRNIGATAPDSIFRSGTAIIEGVDETVDLGTLDVALTQLPDFKVQELPGEPNIDETTTEFSFTSSPVILNGGIGITTYLPDTVTFSGNGVSLKSFAPAPSRYVFSPNQTVPGDVPITMYYTNQTNGCASDRTKTFRVLDQSIQGIPEQVCKNDESVYTLNVNPVDLVGYTEDASAPFKFEDKAFGIDPGNPLATARYITPSVDMILYTPGGVPTSPTATVPIGNITSITINPINPLTGTTFAPWIYDFYCYYTCGYIYNTPITNPPLNSDLYSPTSFIQFTIPGHGLSVGDKLVTQGYFNYIYPNIYPGATYTVTHVVNANNIIINLYEVYGYPPYFEGGYSELYTFQTPPYNVPVHTRPKIGTQIDFIIPGHTFTDGDQIFMDYDFSGAIFQPSLTGENFTVDVLDANTIRINAAESRSSPTALSIDDFYYNNYYIHLFFSPYLAFPGNYFDSNAGFPYKGAPRGVTANDEFLMTNFTNNWPNSEITIWDFLVEDATGKRLRKHSQKITLVDPPSAVFTALRPDYCEDSAPVNLIAANPTIDGDYTIINGITDLPGGAGQFSPANVDIVDDTTAITYTVTDINGCTSSTTQYVVVHTLPTVDANPNADNNLDVEVCKGTAVNIGGSPSGSVSPNFPDNSLTYSWTPPTGLYFPGTFTPSSTVPNPDVDPPVSQNYTLTVTDDYGCQNSHIVTVTAFDRATVDAGADADICSDEVFDLETLSTDVTGAPSAEWVVISLPAPGTFRDRDSTVIAAAPFPYGENPPAINTDAQYYAPSAAEITAKEFTLRLLTALDPASPCPAVYDDVKITVNTNPAPPDIEQPDPVCVGDLAPNLIATSAEVVNWYRDPALTSFFGSGYNIASLVNTDNADTVIFYAATESISNGCEGLGDAYSIIINPNPVAYFTAQQFCVGEPTQFNATTSSVTPGTISKYTWDFKNGTGAIGGFGPIPASVPATGTWDIPSVLFTNILTTYDVELTVTSAAGCSNTIAFSDTTFAPYFNKVPLRIGGKPNANFGFRKICEGDITDFVNNSQASPADMPLTFAWDFDDGGSMSTLEEPSYQFSDTSAYYVKLIAATNLGCEDSVIRMVPILPYVQDTALYHADFNTSKNGFIAAAYEPVAGGLSSWQWTTPSGDVINSAAGGSGNSWFVHVDSLGTYFKNERSVLLGPCIDVTAIPRPVLTLDYWDHTDLRADGSYVEYAIPEPDGTLEWKRLGSLNQGKNWYDETLIRGLSEAGSGANTIGQPVGQIGWSGNTKDASELDGWTTARIALDTFRTVNNLMLRIVFGSNDDTQTEDGIAFDNFRLSSRNRQVLVENYTVSRTAPGGPSNAATENDNFNNFKNGLTSNEIVKIQYHTNLWPSFTDPIYTENPADPNARVGFYGITNTSVPRVYVDGYSNGDLSPAVWANNYFSSRTLDDSPFEIFVKSIPSEDPSSMITIVDSLVVRSGVTSGKLILHTAIIEIDVNGDSSIVRKMLPTAAGTMLTLPLAINDNVRDTLTWVVDNESMGKDLAIVAWVQDQFTKEIYQATIDTIAQAHIPGAITNVEDPTYADRISMYPNPANHQVNIKLPGEVMRETPVVLFDTHGRTVYEGRFAVGEKAKTINTSDLTGGMYIMQIKTPEGGVARKKVMVIHQ